jgi:hypothetical protein
VEIDAHISTDTSIQVDQHPWKSIRPLLFIATNDIVTHLFVAVSMTALSQAKQIQLFWIKVVAAHNP